MLPPMNAFARGVAPLLGALAIAVYGAGGPPGDGRAEALFLARLAVGLLAATSWIAPRAGFGAAASALAFTAAWTLPAGPPRAATLVVLLAGALAVATLLRLRRGVAAVAEVGVALAVGVQFLLRSDLLLGAPSPRTAFTLLLLPAVAGGATAWLARRHGLRAWIAAAGVACVGPGFNLTGAATLLALAAATHLEERLGSRVSRAIAILLIAAPLLGSWRAGLLIAAAATATISFPRSGRGLPVAAAAALAALFVAFPAPAAQPWDATLVLALVPVAAVTALSGRLPAVAAVLLAIAGGFAVGGLSGLAPAIGCGALAALAEPERERFCAEAQAVWSGALLLLTALVACYPWLRPEPARAALELLGLRPSGSGALAPLRIAIPFLALGLAWTLARRPAWRRTWGWLAVAGVVAMLGARGFGLRAPLVTGAEVTLTGERPTLRLPLPEGAPERPLESPRAGLAVVLDTTLLDAAALPAGAPAAEITVEHATDAPERFSLRAGQHTGDWAAQRADLRGLAPAPVAWISWVAATTPPIFGQRYRARFELVAPSAVRAVTIARAPALPPGAAVVVYGAEVVAR
jgi:hypothetical protein